MDSDDFALAKLYKAAAMWQAKKDAAKASNDPDAAGACQTELAAVEAKIAALDPKIQVFFYDTLHAL